MPLSSLPVLPGLGFPVTRTATFQNSRNESMSGKRTIIPQQSIPRWTWGATYGFLRSAAYSALGLAELETLVGFFNARQADGMCFLFTDAEDNTVTAAGFGSGDGNTTSFQLYRAYGGFAEPVYAPTPSAVYVAGVATGAYTLSSTGMVTFAAAPAAGAALTWDGTFQYLCRFDDDGLDIDKVAKGLHTPKKALTFSSEINP